MDSVDRDPVGELLHRVDEVRGLARDPERTATAEPAGRERLLATLDELTAELERSQRRLIETNVQLVSLREVAARIVSGPDGEETTRIVTTYLCRAFGFDHGFLLLLNRDAGRLEGTWTHVQRGRPRSLPVQLPLIGDAGAVTRALWLNRTIVHHDPAPHVVAALPDGHPVTDLLDGLAGSVCVPLVRSDAIAPEAHELCGGRCIVGDVAAIAPPPGPAADRWEADREERQRRCLACDVLPALGVLGLARDAGTAVTAADAAQLESIALSVAPVVENARLVQDLRRAERFRLDVLDSMPSALVAVSLTGEILTFNRAAEELLGVREAAARGRPFGEMFGEGGEGLLRDALDHGREARRVETVLRTRTGGAIPVRMTTALLRNERRQVHGALATFVDLTAIKAAEEQARRLDRLAVLGRFTSSVAHEIRNPLAGIGAGIQFLSGELGKDPAHRENLEFIQREIRRLDRIVQDLFDVTHPRRLEFVPAPLDPVVRFAAQCLEPLLGEKGMTLEVTVAPQTPPVPHDLDQLQQVVLNLLKNAAEASPAGSILRAEVAPVPGARGGAPMGAVIRVTDPGPGIPPEHLKTLFEPFFTTKPGGSGLGLYISHDIVKRHGGNLTVSSEPGRGTTFQVEIPVEGNGGTA